MPEVYASNEVKAELLDPISGSVLLSTEIPYRRDLTVSERPVYAQRGYHRSNTLSAAHLRSMGSVSLRKDAESLALATEIKRWQKGLTFYALSSDLKGKRYRHPHLRVTFTNADGSQEVVTAYNVKLSDRSLNAADGGIVGDTLSLDVLGGFAPREGGFEPVRALDFHRTGPATYIAPDGTLKTAGDGEARFGFPRAVGPEGPGLIIERESENLLSANAADFETDVTTDIVLVGPDATPVRTLVPTTLPGASGNALRVETFDTINFRGVRLLAPGYGWATVGPWETITAGVMLRIIQGQVAVALSNGPWLTRTVYGAGDWAFCEVTWRNELGVPASVSIEVCQLDTDVPAIFEVDKAQLELGSLATSWIPGGGRRYADRVGIVPPHDLIPWSTDFSKWAKSGVTIVNPAAQDPQLNYTAALLQKAAVGSPAIWIDSGMACSGRTVTFPIWLAAGTLTTAQLRIMDDTQTVGSNLKTVELVPEWRRYDVTYTFPPGVAGNAQVLLYIDQGNTTPGTIYAWHPNLHLGSTPGIDVPTFDSPILPPPSLALDPAWSQNGEAEFDLELPKLTVGDGFGLFSSMDPNGTGATVALWRYSGTSAASGLLIAERTHNGPSGSGGVGRTQLAVSVDPALFGTRVRFKLAWTHEINEQTGVREMWLKTYVNGALTAQVDVAALYGATAWAPIDLSSLISDGNVNAVLSRITIDRPTPRAGYRQAN